MKILSVAPAYPLRGGIANFNETLTNALNEQGHIASIISYSLQYPGFLFPGKTQYTEGDAPKGIEISTLLNSVNPTSWYKTAQLISSEQPDFVILHFWMPFFAPALGTIAARLKKKGIPVVALCHNIVPHEAKFYDRILTKYFVKSCDGFITMAQSVFDDLTRFTNNRNKVCSPHPIYDIFGEKLGKAEARMELGLEVDKKYILFFGMIRQYKGLDLLLEAMAEKELVEANVHLIVAGEFYDKPEYYDAIIEKYKLADRVHIQNDFIPNDKVKYYFSAADIVTQTYHTATQSGISQIAYSFDKPILVTNVGGLAEIVPHNKVGYVVEKDSKAIAQAINDYYENNREELFSRNAAEEKMKFSWSIFVEKITELVRNIKKCD